jgi:ferredoxin
MCTECIGYYDEPSCIAVCPVECIIPDIDNVESVEELRFKFEQLRDGE